MLSSCVVGPYVDDLQGQGGFCELEERLLVDMLHLDFGKAFAKDPHEKLLKKLHFHGIVERSFPGLKLIAG